MPPYIDFKIIQLPSYGLCITLGLVIATIVSYFVIKKEKKCFWDFVIITIIALTFGVIFSKLLYLLVTYPLKDFFPILIDIITGKNKNLLSGGFVFYGGIIGGVIGALIGQKISKCPLTSFIDLYGAMIPLVHSFGRLGCFMAGCCYGIPYDGPFSVVYHNPITTVPAGIGIFPVQLLESILLLILSLTLLVLLLKGKKNIFLLYVIIYGFIRIGTEFLRYDRERGFILGLSTSQVISIVFIIIAVVLLVINRRKRIN